MTKTFSLVLIYILSATASPSTFGQESSLVQELSSAHKKTVELYSNGHFVWLETEHSAEGEIKRRYEYWARDGEYFRLDVQDVTDGESVNKVSKTIVVPEGYAKIAAANTKDAGAIYDFGPAETGIAWIHGHYFIALANRVATVQVVDWLQAWESKSRDVGSLTLEATDSSRCIIKFIRVSGDGSKQYIADMSGDTYQVDHWDYRFESGDASQWATNKVVLTYEKELGAIPRQVQSENLSNFAGASESSCMLEEFDSRPAPIDIFAIPGSRSANASSTSAWTRRLAVLCVGVLLLGIHVYFRKKDK